VCLDGKVLNSALEKTSSIFLTRIICIMLIDAIVISVKNWKCGRQISLWILKVTAYDYSGLRALQVYLRDLISPSSW
jgi:hypothetical protein